MAIQPGLNIVVIATTSQGVRIIMDSDNTTIHSVYGSETMPTDVFGRLVFTERLRRKETSMSADSAPNHTQYVDQHRYRVSESLVFEREPNGAVRVIASGTAYTIPDNLWASLVLTMSEFGERPGDWHKFIGHHMGQIDILMPKE